MRVILSLVAISTFITSVITTIPANFFDFNSGEDEKQISENKHKTKLDYIYDSELGYTNNKNMEKYNPVAEAIKKIIPAPDYDDGSLGPLLVRLAWHSSGTYEKEKGTGGSNGATMRYNPESGDEANRGLQIARAALEPVKRKFEWISYADLWSLAGAVTIEFLGGPKIPWKPGRIDYLNERNVPPKGRLPDGTQGEDHIRKVFYRMGFNDQEIVALIGAHCLGRCHKDRSGFEGPWTRSPTRFSNIYFKMLLNEEWTLTNKGGNDQYKDEDDEIMMMPADLALRDDPVFCKYVELYASDKDKFYSDFSAAFGKLLELGVRRASDGHAKVNYIDHNRL